MAGPSEEGDEHEKEAVADPAATGSGPEATTVTGHTVYIDTRTLSGQPNKVTTPREEAELRDTAAHVVSAVDVQSTLTALAAPSGTTPSSTTLTGIANIAVSYTSQGIPTPGESVGSLSPRAMNKAQLRNGSLWLAHTVRSGSFAAIRWYEVSSPSPPTPRRR